MDSLTDVINAYYTAAFNPNEDAKKAGLEKHNTVTFPTWCEKMEARLKANTS